MESDLISRSAVLENARPIDSFGFAHLHYEGIMVVDVDDIKDLPAIDVVPVVRARWIYSGDMDSDGNSQGYCSRCGAGDKHRADLKNLVPYCWKCGAKMDAKEGE